MMEVRQGARISITQVSIIPQPHLNFKRKPVFFSQNSPLTEENPMCSGGEEKGRSFGQNTEQTLQFLRGCGILNTK